MIRLVRQYSLLLLALLLWSQCEKKDVPEPTTGNPAFTLQVQIGGNALDLQAGNDDYYMFTSFDQDTCGQVVLVGNLAKLDSCTQDCLEAFQIELVHQPLVTGAAFNIDEALNETQSYDLWEEELPADIYLSEFTSITEGQGSLIYNWAFGDGAISNLPNPTHDYGGVGGNFIVELNTIDSAGCTQFYERSIMVDTGTVTCLADFSVGPINTPAFGGYPLTATPSGTAPFTYAWSSGETGQLDTVFIDTLSTEIVCLTITDATGCVDSICKDITVSAVSGDVIVCSTRFDHRVSLIPGQAMGCPGGFIFSYTDPMGRIYRSDLGAPQTGDFVDLIAVSDFDDNENGEATKQVSLRFSATLFDKDGAFVRITDGQAVFGFAYPE